LGKIDWENLPSIPESKEKEVVGMNNIEISYGKQIINNGIDWKIEKGQKWALMGPNGSGKSTLLSYIFADNPQAYSKNLTLFGYKRGTGESIWDIKKRIGFTSSEMHLYYRENVSCLKVVESGFFDSIGLYRNCTKEQTRIAAYFFEVLSINHLKERSFLKISAGEQRIVLFARSLVKNPELLILDEPFHGLDDENKQLCKQLVESYAKQTGKSLIFVTHCQEEIPNCVTHFLKLG
jgi:molybdate transport system ATP-binding protein